MTFLWLSKLLTPTKTSLVANTNTYSLFYKSTISHDYLASLHKNKYTEYKTRTKGSKKIMVNMESDTNESPSMKKALLLVNCILLSIGNCGCPLIMRLYFIHGGKRIWLTSWLLTAGWPLILIVLLVTFYYRRATTGNSTPKVFNSKPRLILASTVLGILTGFDNYLYAYGVARLPVSTAALVIASQLAFTAGLHYYFQSKL